MMVVHSVPEWGCELKLYLSFAVTLLNAGDGGAPGRS